MQSTFPIQLSATQDLRRTRIGRITLAVSASAFVALCAHISVPLFFTPVPITLQTLAVILVGLTLGPSLGFAALLLYLAEGAMGLPVFSPQGGPSGILHLLGPTAGYLFSYPFAAAAAGSLVRAFRTALSQFSAAILAGAAATIVMLAVGAAWLTFLLHLAPSSAWRMGVEPFLPGEALKVIAAALAFTSLRRWQRS